MLILKQKIQKSLPPKIYPSVAKPNQSGFVFAISIIPTNSSNPTTKIKGVSFTKAKNVFAIPGITSYNACGKIMSICNLQYPMPRDLAASY